MRKYFLTTLASVALFLSSYVFPAAAAEDAVVADPDHYVVEFENDQIRIIRVKYEPGYESVMHTHGPNVAVFLTDSKAQMTFPDGASQVNELKAGVATWNDNEEHQPKNAGDEPLELILIEVK